jgi:hypothetical protein
MPKRKILIFGIVIFLLLGAGFFLTNQFVLAQSLQTPDAPATQETTALADMTSSNFSLAWNVMGQGGGKISSAHFKVHSSIGQPAVGNMSSTSFKLHTGFWQNFIRKVFLPLVIR